MMTAERLRWCIDRIGWSQREAARQLSVNESTVRAMARGKQEITPELATWFETLAACHAQHPHPIGWRFGQRQQEVFTNGDD